MVTTICNQSFKSNYWFFFTDTCKYVKYRTPGIDQLPYVEICHHEKGVINDGSIKKMTLLAAKANKSAVAVSYLENGRKGMR